MVVKVYGVPNLLEFASVFESPDSSDEAKYSVNNLIQNLDTRANQKDEHPLTDNLGSKATFRSCFVTPASNLFVLGFDLNKYAMVNAILIVSDIL